MRSEAEQLARETRALCGLPGSTPSGSSSWLPAAGVCKADALRAGYQASRNGTAAIPHVDFPQRVLVVAKYRRRFEPRDGCRRELASSQRARRQDPSGGSVTGRSIRRRPATRSSSRCFARARLRAGSGPVSAVNVRGVRTRAEVPLPAAASAGGRQPGARAAACAPTGRRVAIGHAVDRAGLEAVSAPTARRPASASTARACAPRSVPRPLPSAHRACRSTPGGFRGQRRRGGP